MQNTMMVGWGHTKFGKHDNVDVQTLMAQAAQEALDNAGLSAADIDGVFVGNFNGGLLPQDFSASLAGLAIPELRHTPATRLENACATGSAAIWAARDAVASGRFERALVIGFEKMSELPTQQVGDILLKCAYVQEEAGVAGGFAGIFGQIAQTYFEQYGDQTDALAAIAAKNHRNGLDNPYAHLRRDLSFEFCRDVSDKNPVVAGPLKRSDCSPISDGAAAVVIARETTSDAKVRPVSWLASVQVNDWLPLSRRDSAWFEGAARAWRQGLQEAGLTLDDLDFVETHDCFTIAELMHYEAMGLTPRGQGARAILDGVVCADGRLPVNRSGGLKSKGHPIGATGVSMHVMVAMQLSGTAGDMQLSQARRGAVFNMGGTSVANYLSLLQAH
ncbi:acetyl-CoA acetyltransferase [Orrella sp. 11846]|uniref:acetyl-CoA acetyltransferase n=1 Tax=Orrella sp. 11846 TaxID=3409913 RepID=UPI003B59E82E